MDEQCEDVKKYAFQPKFSCLSWVSSLPQEYNYLITKFEQGQIKSQSS